MENCYKSKRLKTFFKNDDIYVDTNSDRLDLLKILWFSIYFLPK